MKRILVAGSTGYLGSHIVKELLAREVDFAAMARDVHKLKQMGLPQSQIMEKQVTDKTALEGCCQGIDVVFSAVGITRQKDGLTYMEVDYQANTNLLDEAIMSGVRKFVYVSVLHGDKLTHLKICEAKERFVHELQESGIDYCVIRPSGFYSDLASFYQMAKGGRIYLFGDGSNKADPIHGADLAKVCLDSLAGNKQVMEVGGMQILSHQEMAEIAKDVINRRAKITYIPDWVRRALLWLASMFMSSARYGPTEIFLNVMAMDMTTNPTGNHTLRDYFFQLKEQES